MKSLLLKIKFNSLIIRILLSALILIFLICFFLILGPQSWKQNYLGFHNWDSGWYFSIVKNGYVSTVPPVAQRPDSFNVAFFPGYPITARIISTLFHTNIKSTLINLSFFNCFVFWLGFLSLLAHWKIKNTLKVLAVFLILLHPAIFYFIFAYTESTFFAYVILFIYFYELFSDTNKKNYKIIYFIAAVICGFMMTATRLVGVFIAFYPFLRGIFDTQIKIKNIRNMINPAILTSLSFLGAISFFVFCYFKFGRWDLYFITEEIGWDHHAIPIGERFRSIFVRSYDVFAIWSSFFLILFIFINNIIFSKALMPETKNKILCLLMVSTASFFIPLYGIRPDYPSVYRYSIGVWVFAVICITLQLKNINMSKRVFYSILITLIFLYILSSNFFTIPNVGGVLNGKWFG